MAWTAALGAFALLAFAAAQLVPPSDEDAWGESLVVREWVLEAQRIEARAAAQSGPFHDAAGSARFLDALHALAEAGPSFEGRVSNPAVCALLLGHAWADDSLSSGNDPASRRPLLVAGFASREEMAAAGVSLRPSEGNGASVAQPAQMLPFVRDVAGARGHRLPLVVSCAKEWSRPDRKTAFFRNS
jgi:hypothetical protein